jgi:hypothetical protein
MAEVEARAWAFNQPFQVIPIDTGQPQPASDQDDLTEEGQAALDFLGDLIREYERRD